jgi:hypothetical protein
LLRSLFPVTARKTPDARGRILPDFGKAHSWSQAGMASTGDGDSLCNALQAGIKKILLEFSARREAFCFGY